jgi:hypothetical protein
MVGQLLGVGLVEFCIIILGNIPVTQNVRTFHIKNPYCTMKAT